MTTSPICLDLRHVVTEHVQADPRAVRRLAAGLYVPEPSIQRMLTSPAWDLDLAIDAAQVLGLDIAVTTRPTGDH